MDDTVALTYQEFADTLGKMVAATSGDFDKLDHVRLFATHFEVMDRDGDGVISLKEWLDHHKAVGIDVKHARPSFDAMDKNGEGVISKEEYIAYAKEFLFTAEDKLNSSIMFGPLVDSAEVAATQ